MDSKLSSRKFILCCAVLISCTALMAMGVVAGAEYKSIVLGTVGVYVTGNVVQKFVSTGESSRDGSASTK